ncbi:hypothetical protein CJ030_MR2G019940 [Morella rubra]|uniref:Uncharacterized protein n=1 Tax=Morella rubra TaxID=262757 RepID=A0A6A1WA09_9ROSI|nr:hypothetical protein CJ030_MR2G019940 [Morella rubra]
MGREEDHDATVIHSSIALLQERFRQLQRVKEMREERELMRMLAEPKQLNLYPPMQFEPSRLFFHSELITPPRSPPQLPLSLWPPSQSNHAGYRLSEAPSWATDHVPSVLTSLNHFSDISDSDSDVDTSLHL